MDRRGPSDCWLWLGVKTKGYGRFDYRGGYEYAHRYSYELQVAPIPDGLEIDHLCRTPACVNPAHMEPVTHRVNNLRGESAAAKNARKTHCHKGHPLSGDNLVKHLHWRQCRTCYREIKRRYYHNRKKRLAEQAAS